MRTYTEALAYLAAGRNPDDRPIANNTRVVRRGEDVALRFHETDVVTYHPDGSLTLDSGGWRTMTTAARIREFSTVGIGSEGGTWEIWTAEREAAGYLMLDTAIDSARFYDGIKVGPGGSLQAAKARYYGERNGRASESALRKRVREYTAGFGRAMVAGDVPRPDNGDCWVCLMFEPAKAYEETGQGFPSYGHGHKASPGGDVAHIMAHMEETYYVPSLLWNALAARYPNPAIWWNMWDGSGGWKRSESGAKRDASDCARVLRQFLYRRLGV